MKNNELLAFLDEERGSTESINQDEAIQLLAITQACRPSMHEPDEQGISAEVEVGRRHISGGFDNAGVDGEMTLHLLNSDEGTEVSLNMADLVAMARIGARAYLNAHGLR